MTKSDSGSPYTGMLSAANDHYHGVKAINEHGEINYSHSLAKILLSEGIAESESHAVAMANNEIQRLARNSKGIQVHKKARSSLNEDKSKSKFIEHLDILTA